MTRLSRRLGSRALVAAGTLGLLASILLALALRGQHVHQFVAVAVSLLALGAMLTGRLLYAIPSTATNRVLRVGKTALSVCALFLAMLIASVPLGWAIHTYDVHNAKTFCNRLRPKLDSIRRQTGHYPSEPQELLPPDDSLPALLDRRDFYTSDGTYYVFSFSEGDELTPHVNLSTSEREEWIRY